MKDEKEEWKIRLQKICDGFIIVSTAGSIGIVAFCLIQYFNGVI